jgi:hypothetical protein
MKIKLLSASIKSKMELAGKLLNCVYMARDSEKKMGMMLNETSKTSRIRICVIETNHPLTGIEREMSRANLKLFPFNRSYCQNQS